MTRKEILFTATEIVTKDRTAVHGEPEDNFTNIGQLQGVYITAIRQKRVGALLPHDVAILNILQKVARLIQSPHHIDHWIDIAGYAACGAECAPEAPPLVAGVATVAKSNKPDNL